MYIDRKITSKSINVSVNENDNENFDRLTEALPDICVRIYACHYIIA